MTDQSAQQQRPTPVDFARLNREITKEPEPLPPPSATTQPPEQFKPPHMRSSFLTNKGSSDLKMIADSLKRLVWDDAEKLGATISKHITLASGSSNISGSEVAKAVQAAADELRADEAQ